MSASSKAHHLDDSRAPLRPTARPTLEIGATPAKLDFAANPNHYHSHGKLKPRQRARGVDLSPRLLLKLSLECETSPLLDPDFGE